MVRLVVRVITFAALTWLTRLAVGSPLAPQLGARLPGERTWAQLVEIGWWMLGARVAVGVPRLGLVVEDKPGQTQIVSDLLASTIYVATALSVINFVFGVPIVGLVATSGVVAIVLGLALQSTLSDVFSGIAVGLEHAYKPGNLLWVEGGIEGQVLEITAAAGDCRWPARSYGLARQVADEARLRTDGVSTPRPFNAIAAAEFQLADTTSTAPKPASWHEGCRREQARGSAG